VIEWSHPIGKGRPMKKDELPAAITSMNEIPLGPIVERLTREFDQDEGVRLRVVRNVFAVSIYALSIHETREILGQRTTLREFVGPVWHREMQIGYLDLLDLMVVKLSGQTVEAIASDEDSERILKLEAATELWLGNISFRLAIDKLRRAIEQAVHWFNMQLMSTWLEKARRVRPDIDESQAEVAISYCDAIFADESYGKQHNLIDRCCYFMGGQIVNSVVAHAYELLMAQDSPQALKDLFAVTRKDLTSFAVVRMSGRTKAISFLSQTQEEAKVAEEDSTSPWRTTPAGIIIPKTT